MILTSYASPIQHAELFLKVINLVGANREPLRDINNHTVSLYNHYSLRTTTAKLQLYFELSAHPLVIMKIFYLLRQKKMTITVSIRYFLRKRDDMLYLKIQSTLACLIGITVTYINKSRNFIFTGGNSIAVVCSWGHYSWGMSSSCTIDSITSA